MVHDIYLWTTQSINKGNNFFSIKKALYTGINYKISFSHKDLHVDQLKLLLFKAESNIHDVVKNVRCRQKIKQRNWIGIQVFGYCLPTKKLSITSCWQCLLLCAIMFVISVCKWYQKTWICIKHALPSRRCSAIKDSNSFS